MPDDARTDDERDRQADSPGLEGRDAEAPEAPDAGHDDIMRRLLDYQQRLREGATPRDAAASTWQGGSGGPGAPAGPAEGAVEPQTSMATRDIVDLSSTEAEIEPEADVQPAEEVVADVQPTLDAEPGEDIYRTDETEPEGRVHSREEVEPELEAVTQRPPTVARSDVEARITELERTLDRLRTLLGGLRKSFQDMAVSADERLAAIESEIAEARPDETS